MTSSIAPVALTYDGTDIQDTDGIFLEITLGLFETGDTRGVDVTVPGADGQVVRPRRFHQRKVLLAGFVRGVGVDQSSARAAYWGNLDAVRTLFDETGLPKDLVATLPDGSVRTIAARTIPDGRILNEQAASEFAFVSIELLALEDWSVEEAGS